MSQGFNLAKFARPHTALTSFGYTGSGGSDKTQAANTWYCVSVTPAIDSLLVAVAARIKQSVANVGSMGMAVWTDDATGPDLVVGISEQRTNSLLMITSTPTYRWMWLSVPSVVMTGGTKYWVGVRGENDAPTILEYAAGTGSTYSVAAGGLWAADNGASGQSRASSTDNYLIQGRLLAI